jgi:alkylation response protein AidB-like acyl-CoA dehydrogenase
MAMDLLADHGGLHEQKLEKIFRDVRLTRIFEGTNQINRLSLIEDWQDQLMNFDQGIGV